MLMQKPSQAATISTKHSSLRITLFIDVLLLLTITVISTAVGAFFLAKSELSLRAEAELQRTVQAHQALFADTLTKQREQISAIGRSTEHLSPSLADSVGFDAMTRIDTEGHMHTMMTGIAVRKDIPPSMLAMVQRRNQPSFLPIIDDNGWQSYIITAPEMRDNVRTGTIVALFSAQPLASQIFSVTDGAESKEIYLVLTDDDQKTVTVKGDANGAGVRVYVDDASEAGSFLRKVRGSAEGYGQGVDYAGIKVLAAYKTIPSIGWSIIATIDQYQISSAIFRLAINIAAIGLAFVGLLSLSTFFLARRITEPLEKLSRKLNGLETRHWHYERSIYTGNELETVDEAGFELTQRLRTAHDHLEDIVKERTEALRAQLTENKAILESIDYGIFVTDDAGKIVYTNKAGETLVGRQIAQDEKPTAIGLLKLVNKDGGLLSEKDHPIHTVLREGKQNIPSTDPEYSIRIADGKDIAVQVRVTPILRGKRCIGVVAVLRDTTEERRIDKIKSEFISLVSHQLRTPLSSMRWYLEMLTTKDAGPLTTDQEEYVREASTSNARMVHLVNGLLNVSRLEMGKMQTKTEVVNTAQVVKETADTFGLELTQKNITLAMTAESIDGLSIHSDRGLLQLIIENFLSNAIKYSKENTTIALRLIGDATKKTMTISVADTGIGIPMEQREFIGTRLFRGANARLENTDGNGLGLYISTIAAEAIGATLTFESKENEGSTFILTLPVIGQ